MGAFVQAKNQQNNMLYSVLSGKQGRYRIENSRRAAIRFKFAPSATRRSRRAVSNLPPIKTSPSILPCSQERSAGAI